MVSVMPSEKGHLVFLIPPKLMADKSSLNRSLVNRLRIALNYFNIFLNCEMKYRQISAECQEIRDFLAEMVVRYHFKDVELKQRKP